MDTKEQNQSSEFNKQHQQPPEQPDKQTITRNTSLVAQAARPNHHTSDSLNNKLLFLMDVHVVDKGLLLAHTVT